MMGDDAFEFSAASLPSSITNTTVHDDPASGSSTPTGRSHLDFTGATIHDEAATGDQTTNTRGEAPDIVLPNQEVEYIRHIALDIGGSLVKLVYFSSDPQPSDDFDASTNLPSVPPSAIPLEPVNSATSATTRSPALRRVTSNESIAGGGDSPSTTQRGGRLHFVKFETSRVDDAIDFIAQKRLHKTQSALGGRGKTVSVRATGGGAYKFADLFKKRLGVVLKKEDEMDCLVGGCNFLLRAIRHEAFTFENGQPTFVSRTDDLSQLYPYLLVNIGSGVSMVKVDGDGQFERVSGTNLGGGTFWGLCRLLTKVRSFDEMLVLSRRGNNSNVDMLVGDIYGGRDYEQLGLSASTIASSFGKVVSQDKELEDYDPADIALALCRMVSYNIGHLAFLNAKRYNISRVFFGGFFIRGHPYTMETISYAIRFWSKGEMAAMFLRHEGFLGAMGAFLKAHPIPIPKALAAAKLSHGGARSALNSKVFSARFVERFAMGAPFTGGSIDGRAFSSLSEKVSWVEKFVVVGTAAAEAARDEHKASQKQLLQRAGTSPPQPGPSHRNGPQLGKTQSLDLQNLLHAEAGAGAGDGGASGGEGGRSLDLNSVSPPPAAGMDLKIGVLHYSPSLEPFPLLADPAAYDPNTIDIQGDAQEREFWLSLLGKTVDNVVEKAVTSSSGEAGVRRRAGAMGKALKAHFARLANEPDAYGPLGLSEIFEMREDCLREFGFFDIHAHDKQRENAAAAAVLADLLKDLDAMPHRERLLSLVQGVLAANIFDWGAQACVNLYHNGTILDIYQEARSNLSKRPWRVDHFDEFARFWFSREREGVNAHGRVHSPYRRVMLFVDNAGADAVLGMIPFARELLCMGAEVVMVANSYAAINDITSHELCSLVDKMAAQVCPVIAAARAAAKATMAENHGRIPPYPGLRRVVSTMSFTGSESSTANLAACAAPSAGGAPRVAPAADAAPAAAAAGGADGATTAAPGDADEAGGTALPPSVVPKLYVCGSGGGSPCLDLRRISNQVAEASVGVDLLIIEGMGRAIHTNYHTKFRCCALKLAMIKTERIAKKLFGGDLFDCMCRFDMPG